MEEDKEQDFNEDEQQYFDGLTYEKKCEFANVISKPMAPCKMATKIMKLLKKGSGKKKLILGVKAVPKAIKKGTKGIVVLAGDVSPMDVIIHVPKICEDGNVPYCFIPCRRDLGTACGSKRSVAIVMIEEEESYKSKLVKLGKKISAMPIPFQ